VVACYDYGGIVEDGVLVRFSPTRFWFSGGEGYSEQWLYSLAVGKRASVRSLLDSTHVLSVQGPRSRTILQKVTDVDLSPVKYYGLVPSAMVAGIPVVITRTGWTGELGYDIYVDVAQGPTLYQRLWDAGAADGLHPCAGGSTGIRRVEASILMYGQDMDWTTTPFELGLDWMIDFSKPSFRGKTALEKIAEEGPPRKLVGLELEGADASAEHDPVMCETSMVGAVTSATFSVTLNRSIAMAMVERSATESGTRLVVRTAAGERAARVVPMPFYDPKKELARA
jgi:aminomethyltransferase